jgi:hypothetical protein
VHPLSACEPSREALSISTQPAHQPRTVQPPNRQPAGTYDVNVLVAGRGATGIAAFKAPKARRAAPDVQA